MKILIIVPAYQEARYLGRFLTKLKTVVRAENIIVVDDGSTDKTAEIANCSGVNVLVHDHNLGKGAALRTGCEYAFKILRADSVIIMDGDDQHEVEDLKYFVRELKRGIPVVLGVRKLDATMPFVKLFGNKLISILINILVGGYLADIPSGFKAFTKNAYKKLLWKANGYDIETEFAVKLLRSKLKYVEVPISTVYHDKDYGFNLGDALKVMLKLPYWIWLK